MSILITTDVVCDGCEDRVRTTGPEADPIGTLARARAMGWQGSMDEIRCPECTPQVDVVVTTDYRTGVERFECETGHRVDLTSAEIEATGNGGLDLRCECGGRLKVLIPWR